MSTIISIGTAVPAFGLEQSEILEFMKESYATELATRKLSVLFSRSGIDKRYSSIPDFMGVNGKSRLFHQLHDVPDVKMRLDVFRDNALSLSVMSIRNSFKELGITVEDLPPTHLITVTCTGLYSPGLDTELINILKLPGDVFRTAVNFLGCNAAFHAFKMADMIARLEADARILIVCVELCTLHFQPKFDNDNLLSNTIFGDGAAAALVVSDSFSKNRGFKGLKMEGFYSRFYENARNLMGWNITQTGFEMILNAELPEFIGSMADDFIQKAFSRLHLRPAGIDKWAIHPGGKRILDLFKRELQLTEEDLRYSYEVLREYGNMSSPTVLFVLKRILDTKVIPGDRIFSVGFGPGLTIDSALFTYVS